ncbi:ABC transporter ATP-binding protein [Ferrovibrio sp. MS7]|uniref:ABC transporter ATP-binding protein n=1 Tax=Ferrovibrio plantarum TaxID=3119164 RepID=UPI003135BEC1
MSDPILRLENMSAYYGNLCAIRDVSFAIAPGETVCLIGPNGAGKTTLLKAISGVLDKVQGEIRYLGEPAPRAKPQQMVAQGLIQVPEGRQIFAGMTVAENIRIGGFKQRGTNQAEMVEHVLSIFPRLRERRDQLAGTLSGGEQQMLAMGRALMGKPKLLMLDEPSMGLAPLVVREIYREIAKLRDLGVTILLVEQNAKIALNIASRAIILSAGEMRYQGDSAALLGDKDLKSIVFGH